MRYFVLVALTAGLLAAPGVAIAVSVPEGGGSPAPVLLPPAPKPPATAVITTIQMPPSGGGKSTAPAYPSGCRDVDIVAKQTSFLFRTTIYAFHQVKHWCWSGGVISSQRFAWSFSGSATACLDVVYPANSWYFTYWHSKATSGHYSEERAHVTNCIFHVGDWKEFYPDVKIWANADGTYKIATAN